MTEFMNDDEIVQRAEQILKKREGEKEKIQEQLKKDKEEKENKYKLLLKIASNKFSLSLTLSYGFKLALEDKEKYERLLEQIRIKQKQKKEHIKELFDKQLSPEKRYLKLIDIFDKKEISLTRALERKEAAVLTSKWNFEERVKELVTEIVICINELYECPMIKSRPDILSDFKKTEHNIQEFLKEEKWFEHKKLFEGEPYIEGHGPHTYIEKTYGITYESWMGLPKNKYLQAVRDGYYSHSISA
jgi:hypothetical protein